MSQHTEGSSIIRPATTPRRHLIRGIAGGAVTAAFMAAGWTVEAKNPPAYTVDGATSGYVGPVNVVLLFGHPSNFSAFEEYYVGTHIPLASKMPLFQRMEGCKALHDAGGGVAIFYRMETISFASESDMEASIASAEGLAMFDDVRRFATGGVTATIVRDIESIAAAPRRRLERRTP